MITDNLEKAFLVVINPLQFQMFKSEIDLINHEFSNLLKINRAVEDFVADQVDEETFLDIVEECEMPMDFYIDVAQENLKDILGA